MSRTEAPPAYGRARDAWVYCGTARLPVPAVDGFEPPARLVPADDTTRTFTAALAHPVDSPPLGDLVRTASGAEIVIAVPDASRACPTPIILEHLLDELNAAGVTDERIAIAIGCGLHATTSPDTRRALVGERAAARVDVFDAQALTGLSADLGTTSAGVPIVVHRRVAGAALVIAAGIVEPHLYAGFSGGVKAVAIGCAGEPTIAWTHDPGFIGLPGVELGRLDGNPFQAAMREVAARTPLRFAVNAVVDDEGRPVAVAAGDPARAQAALATAHAASWTRDVDTPFDVVVAGVPAPKSDNLYQATRAATYVGLPDRCALNEGGTIVLCADLRDGAGEGPGERNFAALLAAATPADIVRRGSREPLGPGGQRAFVVARVLERFRLAVVGARDDAWLSELGIETHETLAGARAAAEERLVRRPRVLAVADALATIVRRA